MKINWKKIGLNLLYPHIAVIILLLPISVAFLVFSLIYLSTESILAIVSYLIAFYVLLVIAFRVPRMVQFFKTFKHENKYMQKWFSDVNLRMNVSLYGSLVWNLAFAIFQLWLGFSAGSVWFYAMFAYYVILATMRFFLVGHTKTYKPAERVDIELKQYKFCGWLLLIMNLAMSVIIIFLVKGYKNIEYHMITTIALAAYTFFTFTFAIVNVVRYKKYNSPVYSAAKIVTFVSACVSMITLETAMLTAFGGAETETFKTVIISATGAVVALFTILVSIFMIVKSTQKLKLLKENQSQN